ncbi:hypothetical protein B0O80DRAFT_246728 [Mortierella sp. GBAus27b]|nr:hypothetical protein B0O80DRAFT_246728 [Mortierella sp. GBAus27b]
MGNSKSRHAGGSHSKSRSKHSRFQSGGGSSTGHERIRASKHGYGGHQQPLPNDSGHYSIHGCMPPSSPPGDRPETPPFQNNVTGNSKRNSTLAPYHGSNHLGTADQFKNGSSQYYHYNDPSGYTYPQADQTQYQNQQHSRLTATYPNNKEQHTPAGSSFVKADVLAGAGPLIENNNSSQRTPSNDQVFARLARQFPTNPREPEKRERIFRWMDQVGGAHTFNPDPETPGWIVPVYPDELDHPESPFYLDRITYELDLMAPVGKPFRKAIDVNCSGGEWAMDLAIKYPKTVVYAVDPELDSSQLPLRVPENCKFRKRDVMDQDGEFDLVHQRLGAFRTQIQEWTPHFAELRRLTKPGGWIQLAESNGLVVRAGIETLKVNRWVERATLSSGLNPMQMVEALMPTILGAGLINVECYDFGIPVGDWGGPRGRVAMKTYLEMVETLKMEIVEMNRLEEGIFEETIELMKMECMAEKAELIMKVICAQKPPLTDDSWRTR